MTDAQLNIIDVHARARGYLTLECTSCGWSSAQDPGGPTLPTLIRNARQHVRLVHAEALASTDTQP